MKVLFDQGTPVPLRRALTGHSVVTAYEMAWETRANAELLAAAEVAGFEVFVTTDKNLRYQQNLKERKIAVVVLATTNWPRLQLDLTGLIDAVDSARPGSYVEVAAG